MTNKIYILKQLKGIILRHTVATMMLAMALPAAAQVPGSALDYMLQGLVWLNIIRINASSTICFLMAAWA